MTAAVVLSAPAARALTERIRKAGEDFGALLLEAHDGAAWRVMGYATWGDYVAGEFAFSRGQSYRLLATATVEKHTGERVPGQLAEKVVASMRHAPDFTSAPSAAYQAALAEQRERIAVPKPRGKRGGYVAPVDRWRQWAEALEEAAEAHGDEPLADPDAVRVLNRLARAIATLLR